ncbi:MAG: ferritin-like domain-containing protein, partial [Verrucomicrobiota bacterium]
MTSRDWYLYFTENLKEQRINWGLTPILDRKKDRKLVRSLQAWQKGETSDGRHLLRAAGKYAKKRQDPDYLSAITLFIQEEQKHGENLGKYLDKIGADRIRF